MALQESSVDPSTDPIALPMIRILGGASVEVHGEPISIGGVRQRRLLALLVFREGAVASLDWLGEHLWADQERPDDMVAPLRTYVSRLRRSLPEVAREWVETESSGYRLTAPDGAVDLRRAQTLRSRANRARELGDPQLALELLDHALGLWRGEPYRELEDFDWARAAIEQVELDRLEMMEERWEAALALGRHTQITGELAAFTTEHGLRDRAVRQHALALHRSGRTAEGLRVIEALRGRLAEESGLEPSRAVLELETAMLADDESLVVEKIGRPLRGYRLLEEIGNGAFAVVWRGVQPSVGRDVAIKQIRSELASQPEFIRRFEAEAHLVAAIEHPHIVPLIDFWRDPNSAYLVLRWLRGGTLERRLDDGPLSVPDVVRLAREVGSALASAHAQGVVHRDVKPANILFDHEGNAFLSDFGIALEIAASNGPEAALSPGSPAYASPEQQRREQLGPEADVYSFGVVLSECLDPADTPAGLAAALERATSSERGDRFATVGEFLEAFTIDGRLPAAGAAVAPPSDSPVALVTNPYKGLRAFEQGDDAVFFGRERLVHELVSRLGGESIESRCVVLVGPSGSGKSSAVRAGLLPAIRRGETKGADEWFITTMVPGTDPYESLEAALLRVAVNPPLTLLDQLRDGPRGVLRSVRRSLGSDDARVLLTIDQFEEVFVGAAAEHSDEFLEALAVAIHDPASPLRLAITIRADFYDRPLAHPAFASIVKACAVEVTPLAGDELERAIVEPARRAGVAFEPGLVSTIAAETARQTAALPLMQYALSELFDRRSGALLTVDDYERLGGITGALATRAESIYTASPRGEQEATRRLFGRMTDLMGTSAGVRRRVPIADLADDAGSQVVLEDFGTARLLTFDRDPYSREPTVEVAHEALLREWPRLVSWLEEDSELLRSVASVGAASNEWNAGGRQSSDLYRGWRLQNAVDLSEASSERFRSLDRQFIAASEAEAQSVRDAEAKRFRRLRRLVVAIAGALAVALVAGGLAVRQSNRADEEAQRARDAAAEAGSQAARAEAQAAVAEEQTSAAERSAAEAEMATLISRSAAQVGENPDLAVLLALAANRRSSSPETEYAVLNALGSSTIVNRTATFDYLSDDACPFTLASSDGATEFGVADGRLVSRSTFTGTVTDHGPSPDPCSLWIGSIEHDRRVALSEDGRTLFLGPFLGDWEVERKLDRAVGLESRSLTDTDRVIVQTLGAGRPKVLLLDGTTGEVAGEVPAEAQGLEATAVSADGSLLAVSYGFNFDEDGSGITIIADGSNGEEFVRFRSVDPLQAMVIDEDADELIATGRSGSILTFDLDTGALIAEVQGSSTAGNAGRGLTVRPDGSVVHVTRSRIETFDRRRGPLGDPVPIQDVGDARIRTDGAVVTWLSGGTFVVIDPSSNALVRQSWEVAPVAEVHMADGTAVVVAEGGGNPEVVDLATGDRSSPELRTEDGELLVPATAFPHGAGIWAQALEDVSYWEGADQRSGVQLWGFPGTSNRYENRLALVVYREPAGFEQVKVVDFDELRVVLTIPAPFAASAVPSSEGGVHILYRDGRLHTHDADGGLVSEIVVKERDATLRQIPPGRILGVPISIDSLTGRLAMWGFDGEALIIDPAEQTVDVLPGVDDVVSIGFVRDGEFLIVVREDGTVSLWDVERGISAGQLWRGAGSTVPGIPWYDEVADSAWVATSGRLLEFPLDPAGWVEQACRVVERELTQEEWDRFVPGDEPRRDVCA